MSAAFRSNAFDGGEETYQPRNRPTDPRAGVNSRTETAEADYLASAVEQPPARALTYFERELAEHTCSFGDRCAVRLRAAELEVGR